MSNTCIHERTSHEEIEKGQKLQPKFDSNGLIPCITTEVHSNEVIMFAWMNREALKHTIETGKATILTNTGMLPNTLVLGYNVFAKLKRHPEIVDLIKYTNGGLAVNPTQQLLAQLFGLSNVYVAMGVKATNVEGETAAMAMTHGKHALLCYVNPNPGLLSPSAGYTFSWGGVAGGIAGATVGMSSFYIPELKADRIEGESAFDNKIVGSDLGYMCVDAIS